MSSVPHEQQPVEPQATALASSAEPSGRAIPAKRPAADDKEIQFISSNPVKKRRQSEQKPIHAMVQPPLAQLPQNDGSSPQIPSPFPTTQTTPPARCRSMAGAQPNAPAPESIPENRGTSLPALENFVFPQALSQVTGLPRLSEALSPTQLSQALPPPSGGSVNIGEPVSSVSVSDSPSQNSVGIDQISCLDFQGVPTNAPGFDVTQIFSTDGGLMSSLGMGNISNPAPGLPPFSPLANPNAIPFTMYSTGNIMPMPQSNYAGQPAASFNTAPMKRVPWQSAPGNVSSTQGQHQHLPENSMSNRSPSPTPRTKPPCLHCVGLRKKILLRQARGAARSPSNDAVQPHHPPNHNHSSICHSPLNPTSNTRSSLPPISIPGSIITCGTPYQSAIPPPVSYANLAPHSPSYTLALDIAETVKSAFPYVQVAARHNIPPARVAEVVSSMLAQSLRRGSTMPSATACGVRIGMPHHPGSV